MNLAYCAHCEAKAFFKDEEWWAHSELKAPCRKCNTVGCWLDPDVFREKKEREEQRRIAEQRWERQEQEKKEREEQRRIAEQRWERQEQEKKCIQAEQRQGC